MKQRKDILERKDDILKWISENRSKQYICRELSCKSTTLNKYLNVLGINYEGNKSHKGYSCNRKQLPIEIFLNNEKPIKSLSLKNRLIKEGIKNMKCENCGLEYWQGVQIPLELHHVDGNHFNNNLSNLKVLCPNCHALTDNYRGRAKRKYEHIVTKHDIHIRNRITSKNYCADCGKEISRHAKRCKSCEAKKRYNAISKKPERDVLKNIIRHYSFLQIGKKYGVSDNAIRKWCKSYNLPYHSSEIKKISDDEWSII